VLSVDALVEGVHFDRAFTPPDAIGHRALAVNLSDLAAMGASPRLALVSMALPPALPMADFEGIADGLTALAARHRVQIVGGNLTRSPGPLMIDITVVGTVKRRQALTRAGARAGDKLYVSGTIGAAAAGLRVLRSRTSLVAGRTSEVASGHSRPATSDSRLATGDLRLVTAYLLPQPRVHLGVHLARNRAAAACIDLSDGLADGLHQIAGASGVGVTVDADALPIDPATRSVLEQSGQDPVAAALAGGDDYELLIAVRPRARRRLAARRDSTPLTLIGACTAERGVWLRSDRGVEPIGRDGFSHFR